MVSAKKKKLLFFVNVDWFFVSHRLPIALAALERGYEVHLLTQVTNKEAELRSLGLVVHHISLDRNSQNICSIFFDFLKVVIILFKLKPDLLHAVTLKPVLLGCLASRIASVPNVVAAISGLGFVFVGGGILSRIRRFLVVYMYRLALGHPNIRVIFQNTDDRQFVCRIAELEEKNTVLIPGSGANLSLYQVTPLNSCNGKLVVFASRLLADKGVREFVEAARLLNEVPDYRARVRFAVVGEPDPANPTSIGWAEIDSWAEEGIVEVWGYCRDIPRVLSEASFLVLPSYYREGVPKILIEASACGRAVITTDMPGCRDAIEPGITGLLVPPRDVKSLANAMRRLIDDQALCVSMGQAGRRRAERLFDEKYVVSKHLSIYESLCSLD